MSKTRHYSLDFIKVLGTIFILFHHYQQFICGSFADGLNFYGGCYNFGYMVELFFILSGFFMFPYICEIQYNKSFKTFFLTRYLRLVPLVSVAAIIYQGLVLLHIKTVGTAWFMHSPKLWETLVAALGMQEGWVFANNTYVNYPVWYVSVLLLCYVLFYVVTYISKKMHFSVRYLYFACIFGGLYINACNLHLPFLNEYTARGYYAFFFGVLLSTYYYERSSSNRECIFWGSVFIILIDIIAFHTGFVEGDIQYLSTFLLFPAIIIIFRTPCVEKLFKHRFFSTLAAISFNAFLWHMPLIVILLILNYKINISIFLLTRTGMVVFTIVTMLIGALSHFLIERRTILLCKKYQK